jgi:hypothetical protein
MVLDTKHFIGYGLAIVLALGLVYTIESKVADKAQSRADLAEAKAELISKQNADFQAQVSSQLAQLQAENASLAKALTAREQVEKLLPTKNGSLTATQVSSAISQALNAKQGEVSASGDTITVDLPLGQEITTALQLVPLLQTDKTQLQTELANETKALDLEKQSHASDVNALNVQISADKVELKAVKAQARRSKLRWFAAGVVVGFLGRGFAKF